MQKSDLSRRRFVKAAGGATAAALGAWLWVPVLSHAQTTPPKPPPGVTGTPTPTPVPRRLAAPGTAGVALFLEFPQAAADTLNGELTVSGESEDATHPGTIELRSADLGLRDNVSIGSAVAGAGAGKAQFEALRISKAIDAASPSLFAAATQGVMFPEANLWVRRGGGVEIAYAFKDVVLSSLTVKASSASEQPTETIEFAFGAMQVSGAAETPSDVADTAAWSQVLNQPVFDVTP